MGRISSGKSEGEGGKKKKLTLLQKTRCAKKIHQEGPRAAVFVPPHKPAKKRTKAPPKELLSSRTWHGPQEGKLRESEAHNQAYHALKEQTDNL